MTGENFSRRAILAGLLAGAGQSVWADIAPGSSLRPVLRPGTARPTAPAAVGELIKTAGLGGKIGYVVANAASGEVLEAMNPVLGLPPASVAKAMTAQYALEALGSEHRFATRLVAVGRLQGGRLEGDLVLLGGGDPALNTNGLAEMAAALKATGLREVTGRFLVHSGALPSVRQIDAGQPDYLGYNPAISGLNLNFNRVHFEWKKVSGAYQVTMQARSAKYRPEIALTSMKIVDRKTPVYTYANGGRAERWTVARAALGSKGARWLPVRQPELYAGEVLQVFAGVHGIVLRRPELGRGAVSGTVLVERESQPLGVIVKAMMARSTNLTAEVLGLSASIARGRPVAGLVQSGREMSGWMQARLGARKPRFVDHSGLGDKSRLSASDMAAAMVAVGADSTLGSMLKTIKLGDKNGQPRLGTGVVLKAKTGSLNFVSGLSGFVGSGDDKTLAFAIFSADMARRSAIAEADRERPPGAHGWAKRARNLQWGLIERWVRLYG